MIVVIGPLALIAAVVAVASAATNSGSSSTEPLSGTFVISGPRRGTTTLRVSRDRLTGLQGENPGKKERS